MEMSFYHTFIQKLPLTAMKNPIFTMVLEIKCTNQAMNDTAYE